MVTHQQCNGVAEVDKFLNKSNLSLAQVKIVSVAGKFGSSYMVFYNDDDIADDPEPEQPATAEK